MPSKSWSPTKLSSFEELLNAGILAVSEKGIDNVTVLDVITISGHSRPTFYSYFSDINALLAEIWLKHGRAIFDSDLLDLDDWDVRVRDAVPGLGMTVLQILCVAHRIPELDEILSPELRQWWKQKTDGNRAAELKTAWILGIQLGIGASLHVDEAAKKSLALVPLIRLMPDDLDIPANTDELAVMSFSEELPEALEEVDAVDAAILRATMAVTANSGVKSATLARIARICRVSTGSIYPRFKNQKELIEKAFVAAIRDVVVVNTTKLRAAAHPFDEFARSINSALSSRRNQWRNFRLELHVAAMHDKELALGTRSGFDVTRQVLAENIQAVGPFDSRHTEVLSYGMQTLALGFSILHNAGLPLRQLDHRIMVQHLGAQIAQTN